MEHATMMPSCACTTPTRPSTTSRLAYSEIHADERAETCAAFLRRAAAFYAAHGRRVERLLTDNAKMYRCSQVFRATAAELAQTAVHPSAPAPDNGKVERYNRTLLEEWAYVRLYRSNGDRRRLLSAWVHRYKHHRSHTALKGEPPISRVNNLAGNYN